MEAVTLFHQVDAALTKTVVATMLAGLKCSKNILFLAAGEVGDVERNFNSVLQGG